MNGDSRMCDDGAVSSSISSVMVFIHGSAWRMFLVTVMLFIHRSGECLCVMMGSGIIQGCNGVYPWWW